MRCYLFINFSTVKKEIAREVIYVMHLGHAKNLALFFWLAQWILKSLLHVASDTSLKLIKGGALRSCLANL